MLPPFAPLPPSHFFVLAGCTFSDKELMTITINRQPSPPLNHSQFKPEGSIQLKQEIIYTLERLYGFPQLQHGEWNMDYSVQHLSTMILGDHMRSSELLSVYLGVLPTTCALTRRKKSPLKLRFFGPPLGPGIVQIPFFYLVKNPYKSQTKNPGYN